MTPSKPSATQMRLWLGRFERELEKGLSLKEAGRFSDARRALAGAAEALYLLAGGADSERLRAQRLRQADEIIALIERLPSEDGVPLTTDGRSGPGRNVVTPNGGPVGPCRSLPELMEELDALIGLDGVKAEVRKLTAELEMANRNREHGIPVPDMTRHIVFSGNPGTGKTTVARLLAEIYRALGLLPQGHLVEVDAGDLIAEYVGQTMPKTRKVVESALGGMLFIDEAYMLAADDRFAPEAIATLLRMMEDHRDNLVVVAAGYTEKMKTFLKINPGLPRRFARHIHFDDYSPEQLFDIFMSFCRRYKRTVSPEAAERILQTLERLHAERDETFGNAGLARNLFQRACSSLALRLQGRDATPEEMSTFEAADVADCEGTVQ